MAAILSRTRLSPAQRLRDHRILTREKVVSPGPSTRCTGGRQRAKRQALCDSAAMRVHIGTDHAGFELKNYLVTALTADGHDVVDHGPESYDPEDDYPTYCIPVAEGTVAEPGSLGIVIGGARNGGQGGAHKGLAAGAGRGPG